jgi:glycosyltransferase involved in cell wall biosynthesis
MRVFMIAHYFRPVFTGMGIQIEFLAPYLKKTGVETTLLTPQWEKRDKVREELPSLQIIRFPVSGRNKRWKLVSFSLKTLAYLWRRRKDYDVVHFISFDISGIIQQILLKLLRKPAVLHMTLLGADDPSSVARQRYGRLRKFFYGRFDGYMGLCEAFEESYRSNFPNKSNFITSPMAVDILRFNPPLEGERAGLKKKLGFDEGEKVIAFVGSLIHRKGVDTALETFLRLRSDRNGIKLMFVGKKDFPPGSRYALFFEEIQKRIESSGFAGDILLTGEVENPEVFLKSSDIFLFPSRREGFGAVLAEAMASGVVCVTRRIPKMTDTIVEDGVTGCVIDGDDPGDYREALSRMLEGGIDALSGMAGKGVEKAFREYAPDVVAGKWKEMYHLVS